MFEQLEPFLGTSTMICEARETLPEPSRFDYPIIQFINPFSPNLIDISDPEPTVFSSMEKHAMIKTRMVYNGTVFWAWKSEDDGKIYI